MGTIQGDGALTPVRSLPMAAPPPTGDLKAPTPEDALSTEKVSAWPMKVDQGGAEGHALFPNEYRGNNRPFPEISIRAFWMT
jgi:hypothetical protein